MTPDPAIRDAMARAMAARDGLTWKDLTEASRNVWRGLATAALDAALDAIEAAECVVVPVEPTEAMLSASDLLDLQRYATGSQHGATHEEVWCAMVDARPGAQP